MKKQIGLNSTELEGIFAQIKSGRTSLDKKVYDAYLPLKYRYAKKFHIKEIQMEEIYEDVFIYIYNNVLNGVLNPTEFGAYFEKMLTKQCAKYHQVKDDFNSEMLSLSYIKNSQPEQEMMAEAKIADDRRCEFATQSLMFVIEFLNQMRQNPELAATYNLSEQKIQMLMDHFGLNKERKNYTVAELATKYDVTESRAKAMIVNALRSFRKIKEFQPIKAQMK